jgi:ribosomal protein L40E
MSVCPVCEAPFDARALECKTCGHIFQPAAVEASIVPLADLEITRMPAAQVVAEETPDLEQTRFQAVDVRPEAAIEGLEATAVGSVEVGLDLTPDLEPTRLAEEELPSALPSQVRCRYCGSTGQKEGLFCDGCGMRLPRLVAERPGEVTTAAVVCTSCGGESFAGGMCLRCGARQPPQA